MGTCVVCSVPGREIGCADSGNLNVSLTVSCLDESFYTWNITFSSFFVYVTSLGAYSVPKLPSA
jgi:hypothetical protein